MKVCMEEIDKAIFPLQMGLKHLKISKIFLPLHDQFYARTLLQDTKDCFQKSQLRPELLVFKFNGIK